jgi:Insect cuticle protein
VTFPDSQDYVEQQRRRQEQQRQVVSHIVDKQAILAHPHESLALSRRPVKQPRFTNTGDLETPRILAALANHAQRVQNNEFQRKTYSPTLHHVNRIDADNHSDDHDSSNDLEKKEYKFAYSVKDRHSGDDFSHVQKQVNGAVSGSYKVRLPDNRIQITKYVADDAGYRAEVTYEGEAQTHEVATQNYQPPAGTVHIRPKFSYFTQNSNRQRNSRYTVTPTPYYNEEHNHARAPTIRKRYPSTTALPEFY